jgi:lipoprotein-releasing system permease protein
LGMDEGYLTGIEITVQDLGEADKVTAALNERLGHRFYARSWMDMNANLFAALKLEKIGMFILLAMVVLIGSFSIVATLVMLVMEKTKDIAVMMSMGATRSMVRRIFMCQGCIIGVVGTLLGNGLGLLVGTLLKKYQFIKLPENVYTLDHLPIIITLPDVLIISASAMLLCFLATLYPARQASRLKPAEALRYE